MIRAFRAEDAAGVLALVRELLPLRVETEASLVAAASSYRCWVAEEDGDVVGFARQRDHNLWLGVAPRARGRGLGAALWSRVEEHADEPAVCWADTEAGVAFAKARGFAPSGRIVVSVLDVASVEAAAVTPPDGVELLPWGDLATVPRELEADEHVASPALRAEGSFAAVVDGRVVSYALLNADERGLGDNGYTLTLPDYRGRGLATLCKRAIVEWARAQGIHTIVAANEDDNAPILALNARLGYQPDHIRTTLTRR